MRNELTLLALDADGREAGRIKLSLAQGNAAYLLTRARDALDKAYLLDPTDPEGEHMHADLAAQPRRSDRLIALVRHARERIDNGRSRSDIMAALEEESYELSDEVKAAEAGEAAGDDGILGEAIDVIQCALDLVLEHYPPITDAEIAQMMAIKCEKWVQYYAESVTRDRSPA